MDIKDLKKYILENNKVSSVLEELGCHHIKFKGDYYTCGNPDGDNLTAITVYLNDNLATINYTRDITQQGSTSDLLSLVEFFQDCTFFNAIKKVCSWLDIDYYHDFDEDLPESLKLTKLILEMQETDVGQEKEYPLKKISEDILSYYKPYVNDLFANDGISYMTQQAFEVGYDDETNRITIPIRDEIGNLVGVKGRIFDKNYKGDSKYVYIEPCGRSKILYGLNLTYDDIKQCGKCYIGESEKCVQQLWSMGLYNAVATGGKKISNSQIDKLTRLCVDLIFLFDKDVLREELLDISARFIDGVSIYAVIDKQGILDEKESPTDNIEKLKKLLENNIYKIK